MRYFYDCEFLEDGYTIDPISIGIVAEDGREYYAINRSAPWSRIAAHDWLAANVLPHLPLLVPVDEWRGGDLLDPAHPHVKSISTIADEMLDFIRGGDGVDHELWAYYGAYDHVVLCQLWGPMINLPACVPMWTHELMQEWERAGRPPKPPQSDEHDALADARWNRDLFHTIKTAQGGTK